MCKSRSPCSPNPVGHLGTSICVVPRGCPPAIRAPGTAGQIEIVRFRLYLLQFWSDRDENRFIRQRSTSAFRHLLSCIFPTRNGCDASGRTWNYIVKQNQIKNFASRQLNFENSGHTHIVYIKTCYPPGLDPGQATLTEFSLSPPPRAQATPSIHIHQVWYY